MIDTDDSKDGSTELVDRQLKGGPPTDENKMKQLQTNGAKLNDMFSPTVKGSDNAYRCIPPSLSDYKAGSKSAIQCEENSTLTSPDLAPNTEQYCGLGNIYACSTDGIDNDFDGLIDHNDWKDCKPPTLNCPEGDGNDGETKDKRRDGLLDFKNSTC